MAGDKTISDTFTAVNGQPIVWRDPTNVIHACEGADVHDRVRLIWTRCATGAPGIRPGSLDVPADGAWKQRYRDVVDCPRCLAIVKP